MIKRSDDLTDRLSRYREITISVTGRKSGRTISLPIWFVWEDGKLYLLPVEGSNSQWYKNVVANASIGVSARDAKAEFKADTTADAAQVKSVIKMFREKYGPGEIKKYYSNYDVAVIAQKR